MTTLRRAVVLIVATLCSACDKSPTSPTSTSTTTTTATTQVFEVTVPPGGASFYSISLSQATQVSVTLASVQRSTKVTPLTTTLLLGIGIPAGEGCAVSESVAVAPTLTTQLTSSRSAGIFCVNVADAGTLTTPVLAVVRVTHP